MRSLGRFHRVQGSPGFAAAAAFMRDKALAAGLQDAVVEHFPADGETRYAHFRSYLGWDARAARLDEVRRPFTQKAGVFAAVVGGRETLRAKEF